MDGGIVSEKRYGTISDIQSKVKMTPIEINSQATIFVLELCRTSSLYINQKI